jgi:hypothetical protein
MFPWSPALPLEVQVVRLLWAVVQHLVAAAVL